MVSITLRRKSDRHSGMPHRMDIDLRIKRPFIAVHWQYDGNSFWKSFTI